MQNQSEEENLGAMVCHNNYQTPLTSRPPLRQHHPNHVQWPIPHRVFRKMLRPQVPPAARPPLQPSHPYRYPVSGIQHVNRNVQNRPKVHNHQMGRPGVPTHHNNQQHFQRQFHHQNQINQQQRYVMRPVQAVKPMQHVQQVQPVFIPVQPVKPVQQFQQAPHVIVPVVPVAYPVQPVKPKPRPETPSGLPDIVRVNGKFEIRVIRAIDKEMRIFDY